MSNAPEPPATGATAPIQGTADTVPDTINDAIAAEPADSDSPEALARRLIGRAPTAHEMAEAAFYDSIRPVLLAARDDASLSQTDVAKRLRIGQSEVSRLETSVGPSTRLGRLQNYLAGCGAHLALVVQTASGRLLFGGDSAPVIAVVEQESPIGSNEPWPSGTEGVSLLQLAGHAPVVTGSGASGAVATDAGGYGTVATAAAAPGSDPRVLIDHILALDAAMADANIPPGQVTRMRQAFLTRLRPQQHGQIAGAAPRAFARRPDLVVPE